MNIKLYLISNFNFNNTATIQLIEKICKMPERKEASRLLSHIINCQNKWLARMKGEPEEQRLSWWEPEYDSHVLQARWTQSVNAWVEFLHAKTGQELTNEVSFTGADGNTYCCSPADAAIHLNFHSVHHRAQILTLISKQGITPDVVDYIRTKFRKLQTMD